MKEKAKYLKQNELQSLLDELVDRYNRKSFIENDPISIPHRYNQKEDIETIGLLVAVIAWGNRKSIIQSGNRLCELFGESPYDWIMHHRKKDLERLQSFVHRTFNGEDLKYFVKGIQHLYTKHGGPEQIIHQHSTSDSTQSALHVFKKHFFELPHPPRTEKHLSDPLSGSAAKRLNMYLRWMVRKDSRGVDFGIWKSIRPSQLSCPLDVHSGRIARELGLLKRKQNDAEAVRELDAALRLLDPKDPVKYDYALFGLGINEGLLP